MAPLNRVTFFARAARARPVAGRRVFNQAARRNYASDGHAPAGSEVPWIIGAASATAGGLYLLWPSSGGGHGTGHGHGDDHGDSHAESKEDSSQEEPKEEEPKEEKKEESAEDEGKQEKKDDGKGESKGEEKDDGKGDEKKKSEDSKDEDDSKDEKSSDKGDDKGDNKRTPYEKYDGKPKGGRENTSSKEGPEHTGARHASSPHSDESKSKKGEGTVETARIKGTVDPKRAQV